MANYCLQNAATLHQDNFNQGLTKDNRKEIRKLMHHIL